MRIKEIEVDGFGAWSNLRLSDLSDHLTVFYGPNEAGKTTLMQFIRGILYGFSEQRRQRYLPPVHGGEGGGSLLIDSTNGRVRVSRVPGDGLGPVKIVGADGSPRNRDLILQLMAGVDEATFNNVFAVGLRELQELNALDATEASQLLYNLTTGLDRVGLMEVMEELQTARQRILGNGETSELEQLLSQRRRLDAELAELETRNRDWYETIGDLTQLKHDIETQQRANEQLEREVKLIDAALPIRHRWDDRELLRNQLRAGDQRIVIAPNALDRLKDIKTQIAQKQKQVKQLKQQRLKLKKDADELGIDPRITDNANRIESLGEQVQWMDALEQQVRQLQPIVGVAPPPGEKLSLVSSLNSFASAPPLISPVAAPTVLNAQALAGAKANLNSKDPQVTSRVLASLRGPARAVREAGKRLKSAKAERDRNHIAVEETNDRLAAELLERGESSLRAATEKASMLATRLRRRIQIEERLEKMIRHRDELEDDIEGMLGDAVVPLSGLLWPGFLFVGGCLLMAIGVLYDHLFDHLLWLGTVINLLAVFAIAASILWKVTLDKQAESELENCNRQLRSLSEQVRQTQDERDEVDRHLPQGGGSLDSRLAKAEQDLEHLQSLVPLDTDRQVAGQRGSGSNRKVELAEEALSEAHDRWRASLRRHKLPETLKPSEIRELAELTEEQQAIDRQKDQQRMELEARERELLGFWGRIDQLTAELKLKPKSEEPRDKLRLLGQTLKDQRTLLSKKSSMGAKYKQLGEEIKRLNAHGRKLSRQRAELFAEMGVINEEELRKLDERKREASRLEQKIEEETGRIEIELETLGPATEPVRTLVENHDRDSLESRRHRLEQQLAEGQASLSRLHQRQGATEQEVHAASDDRRQDRLRLEISGLNRRIGDLVRHWRVLNVSSTVLQKIRHDYENDRQPETLSVASLYLEKLTEGRYRRIWTPFGEAALRIDNEQGQSLPLDVLSAGTREAVFVCLRLALASNFANRGAGLPLVLDDVLVNFDVTRADAAAAVLRDFASRGHQMLLFTCHEHIMEAFADAGAEIRILPGRGAELLEERRRKRAALMAPPEPEVEDVEDVEDVVEVEEVVAEQPQVVEVVEVAPVMEVPEAPPEPQVMLVLNDDEQDEIDEEIEDEFYDDPEEVEVVEVVQEEPDFYAWKSFWFDDDDIAAFAPPNEPEPELEQAAEPVWESAAMWWDGESSAPPAGVISPFSRGNR
ncbi:MAG: AAA family ATPase [Planctomycetales bacterium]|nr:AAA family ATPase [Planctomycetales bacterium]